MAMTFRSILFVADDGTEAGAREAPEILGDLNLDQIIDGITAGKEEYDLKPFFYAPLGEPDAVLYRQEVMRDLEDERLFAAVEEFAGGIRRMREELERVKKLYYEYQKHWWFVDAVEAYCAAVRGLGATLERAEPASRGFRGLKEYVAEYMASAAFTTLGEEARRVKEQLAAIQYSLIIKDDALTVQGYEGEADYSIAVEATFRKFAQGEGKDYRVKFPERVEMNHVEAAALDFVAKLNGKAFATLERFCAAHAGYLDATIGRFDREVQFYLSYLRYIRELEEAGLLFTLPALSTVEKDIAVEEGFDLALAKKLAAEKRRVVTNDFRLGGPERIIIVSGPNNGGKTTFARMFGQLHYLAGVGCKVPGRAARLYLADRIFTHFEREEKVADLRSKFEEDLIRVHEFLKLSTSRSIVVMNESFSSTSLKDAVFIGQKVMRRIIGKDLICLFVTFIDELAALSDTSVSMVSTIVPGDPVSRTYKIVRRAADGRAYAMAVAEKHRLTYEQLRERIVA